MLSVYEYYCVPECAHHCHSVTCKIVPEEKMPYRLKNWSKKWTESQGCLEDTLCKDGLAIGQLVKVAVRAEVIMRFIVRCDEVDSILRILWYVRI